MGNRSIMSWPPWGWPRVIILFITLINPIISFTPIIDDGPKDFHNPNPSFPFEKMVSMKSLILIIMVVFYLPYGLTSVLALGREICLFFHLSRHSSIFSNFLLVFPSISFGPSFNSFRSLSMSVSIARLLVSRCLSLENMNER